MVKLKQKLKDAILWLYFLPQEFGTIWRYARGGLYVFRDASDSYVRYYASRPDEWVSEHYLREGYVQQAREELARRAAQKGQQ